VLVIFGAASDKAIYEKHSLGININLVWGAVLLVFGAFMLLLTWRAAQKRNESGGASDQSGPPKR
jgi:hypothetical protein